MFSYWMINTSKLKLCVWGRGVGGWERGGKHIPAFIGEYYQIITWKPVIPVKYFLATTDG